MINLIFSLIVVGATEMNLRSVFVNHIGYLLNRPRRQCVNYSRAPFYCYLEQLDARQCLSVGQDIFLNRSVVQENKPAEQIVGQLISAGNPGADPYVYSLVSGAGDSGNEYFRVVGDELVTAAVFDYESQDSYTSYGLWRPVV